MVGGIINDFDNGRSLSEKVSPRASKVRFLYPAFLVEL